MIKKWNVYLADLGPREGTQAGYLRPVVVAQTDVLNCTYPSTIGCLVTSSVRAEARFVRVHLAKGEGAPLGSADTMLDQFFAMDNRRVVRKLGALWHSSQEKLAENIRVLLS